MSFFAELKRRNVVRVGAAYIVFAWLVVQVVETIFPAFGFGDEAIRVVVIAAAIGFIPALVFAWAFEWTPSGVQLDSDVARVASGARRPTPTLDRVIVIVLAAALCFFAIDKFVLEPQRDAQLEQAARQEGASSALTESFDMGSIAVLPFVNISADADNEYFCDGIAAELLNLLSKVEGLRVISRSSSFFFKGKNVPISEIAAQLDVALVLEGSVRKVANQVRVTAQLVDARSDTNLWSATFDRELVDIFAIQDEISGAIVGELRSRMGDAVGDGPVASITNADAYDAYLRGKYLLAQRSPASKTAAVAQFRLALQSDENYAPAHAELAIALALEGDQSLPPEARSRQIEHHSSRALQLDPLLPEAYAARAVGYWLRTDPAGAKSDLEQAIRLNPNYAQAYFWLSNTAETEQEAFDAIKKAARLDPLQRSAGYIYVDRLIDRGMIKEAASRIEAMAAFDPGLAAILMGDLESLNGRWSARVFRYLQAMAGGVDAIAFGDVHAHNLVLQLLALGLVEEALAIDPEELYARIAAGQAADIEREMKLALEEGTLTFDQGVSLGFAQMMLGKYVEVHPRLEAYWETIGGKIISPGQYTLFEALYLARLATDDPEGARAILVDTLDAAARWREAGLIQNRVLWSVDWFEGTMRLLSGEVDRGLALMSRAASEGFYVSPFGDLHEQRLQYEGYREIIAQQAVRQARERRILLEVVCAPGNPYADVWKPKAATCDDYGE